MKIGRCCRHGLFSSMVLIEALNWPQKRQNYIVQIRLKVTVSGQTCDKRGIVPADHAAAFQCESMAGAQRIIRCALLHRGDGTLQGCAAFSTGAPGPFLATSCS